MIDESFGPPVLPEPGDPVFDLLGVRLGRVGRVGADRFDVELSRRSARRLGVRAMTIPLGEVVAADFGVSLREEARRLLHPEARAPEPIGE